ncbi:MAG TPA: PEP_CTERM-anchored TLD domain-containing protein [Verrucomicrobiae bacterium]|nr:PEP_CTERM-anchored TLD domain-containing protein [Verrucomicrobiae bacterium]
MNLRTFFLVILTAAFSFKAHAITIVGGSDLLDPSGGAQLESGLGEGPLTLTKIFTHTASFDARGNVVSDDGKTSLDFHAAADGMGRTITLFRIEPRFNVHDVHGNVFDLPSLIVGGYSPQSWESLTPGASYHITADLADRTGAIFNLTDSLWFGQRSDDRGQYQTANQRDLGPSFGGGSDLGTTGGNDLDFGSIFPFTYTPGDQGRGLSVLGYDGGGGVYFSEIEVFAISDSVAVGVPDSGSSLALVAIAFGALSVFRNTQKARSDRLPNFRAHCSNA